MGKALSRGRDEAAAGVMGVLGTSPQTPKVPVHPHHCRKPPPPTAGRLLLGPLLSVCLTVEPSGRGEAGGETGSPAVSAWSWQGQGELVTLGHTTDDPRCRVTRELLQRQSQRRRGRLTVTQRRGGWAAVHTDRLSTRRVGCVQAGAWLLTPVCAVGSSPSRAAVSELGASF